ncbi:hypothetical protein [Kineosporia sp. A_224]|uniref:hypothetical protein n=1 Tax=Kineosporia sp. A_224 TaxID=1962180 RepID=UPI000B4AAFF2|nr:hypothetical protein [Kineosporia sp. A_224]
MPVTIASRESSWVLGHSRVSISTETYEHVTPVAAESLVPNDTGAVRRLLSNSSGPGLPGEPQGL